MAAKVEDYLAMINQSAKYIKEKVGSSRMSKCHLGLVLGSGLGDYADTLQDALVLDYADIPNFPLSTVSGHAGKLVVGHLPGQKDIYVMTMKGRKHYYECLDMQLVTLPVRIFKEVGLKVLFTTNAVGGINENYKVGDFMIIEDHINMIRNPCLGPNLVKYGPRFHDMSDAYDRKLRLLIKEASVEEKIGVQEGIFYALEGPSYETPAEIRFFRNIGADAVGMSTAPEIIVGNHCGLRCVGISCITNMAAGMIEGATLNHEEVKATAVRRKPMFTRLLHASLVKIYHAVVKA